ncbi:hypothetical protein RT717_27515 [Imperialibacter roseus]|uniref:TonB C-terminal domain-containing protein n=1 Tax=Imperialibacter roseus TaxID=1324217 RepID=A0ABZ0IS92_9BACT|nr:hypothetical protein [Imperialibacter roseus]WOK06820.1 hypothetical protein RT717_27515 [Imperialibacter roseus]
MSKPKNDIDPSKSQEEKDLLRYLNEEMSSKEKYTFERKAENDPFLYEAMEGLQDMDVKLLAKDLADMKKKLTKSESAPFYSFSNVWKIAAVVTLLLVAGFSAWRLTNSPIKEEVASSETVPTDSSLVADDLTPALPIANEQTDSLTEADEKDVISGGPVTQSQPATTDQTAEVAPQPVAANQLTEATEDEADNATTPIAIADDIAADELVTQREQAAGAGVALREAELEEVATESLAQEVSVPKLSEFNAITSLDVSSTEDKAKKEASPVAKSAARSASPTINTQLAAPVSGMDVFRKFVSDSQQKTADMVAGEVQLTFSLTSQGAPQNITVSKSLCESCDQEAIRLLQNSGPWKYNDGITGTPLSTITIQISN